MPSGYHFYKCDEWGLADRARGRRAVADKEAALQTTTLQIGADKGADTPFSSNHDIKALVARSGFIRAGDRNFTAYEELVPGHFWWDGAWGVLELPQWVEFRSFQALSALSGTNIIRMAVPDLHKVDAMIPHKTGRWMRNRANRNRSQYSHFGDDIDKDSTNKAEAAAGDISMIMFKDPNTNVSCAITAAATVVIFTPMTSDSEEARTARDIWLRFGAPNCSPARRQR